MTTTTERCTAGAAGVRPLLSDGRRVVVDGHPICAECGGAVEPVAPDAWRHGLTRRARIAPLGSYSLFTRRFPWIALSEPDWQAAARCLGDYQKSLKGVAKRKALAAGENPYLDLFRRLMAAKPSLLLNLAERRRELAPLFSWAIPTDAALELLAKHAPLVECGAGTGYWLALLRARGVDAIGYDRGVRRPWTAIQRSDSVKAARRHPERTLLLCWPPYDDDT